MGSITTPFLGAFYKISHGCHRCFKIGIKAMKIRESFQDIFAKYLEAATGPTIGKSIVAANRADFAMSEAATTDADIVPQYSLQNILRPLYSKGDPQRPDIGDHPDFKHLLGT